ncbi:hypothetical protein [Paenibacillus graminis]|uniref:hypothetical protein n=1 Tax=Paenibacillus graminis TaxID=189425 RepID=UPI002DB88CD8|nr:hypothetical protein [Paenibacillus graminis]MEC0167415.1 hypothetical protein [Paenibacillus graminis]
MKYEMSDHDKSEFVEAFAMRFAQLTLQSNNKILLKEETKELELMIMVLPVFPEDIRSQVMERIQYYSK